MTRLTRVIAPGSADEPLPDVDMSTTLGAWHLAKHAHRAARIDHFGLRAFEEGRECIRNDTDVAQRPVFGRDRHRR